jgi:ATP-dependent DNA helicase RecG
VFDFVHDSVVKGGQAYVVLPLIEESERADLRAAKVMAEQLTQRWPDVAVGLVHGQLKADERDQVMRKFRAGEIKVLVATTVIEVGIDVPNATIMVIDHPRAIRPCAASPASGACGRGTGESHCILLSPGRTPPRLKAFAATGGWIPDRRAGPGGATTG